MKMRTSLGLAALVTIGLLGGTMSGRAQSAYDYPFCGVSQARSGASSCYFATYEQCMATMSGLGFCRDNPFYRGRPVPEPPRRKDRRMY